MNGENVVNEGCVGPGTETAGKASACQGCPNQTQCATGKGASQDKDTSEIEIFHRMSGVKNTILVLSGKGGVGKSTVSAQLAFALAARGSQVGLLDVDICGPSIPRMLGLVGHEVHQSASGWSPVYVEDNLGVMSIGFMLPATDDAVIWRGPKKNGLIKQFLSEVDWGSLDFLIIDTPPGTSDEHISLAQFLKPCGITGAVVVTTPQEVSMADVRKELSFCKKTGINVLGVVENMASISIPLSMTLERDSGVQLYTSDGVLLSEESIARLREQFPILFTFQLSHPLFSIARKDSNCPRTMAEKFGVPFLGMLPMDPNLLISCDEGVSFAEKFPRSPAIIPLNSIVDSIIVACNSSSLSTSS